MTRRGKPVDAFAIVRRDTLPVHSLDPDMVSPPAICGGEYSYTVKEVVLDVDEAIREVDRLNALRQPGADVRYFWQGTHLFLDGGSFGGPPNDGDSA